MLTILPAVAAFFIALDDRPPADDLVRFPPLAMCESMLAANCSHWNHLCAAEPFYPTHLREWFARAKQACYPPWNCWQALASAHRCADHEGYVRDRLTELRRHLGNDAYYRGEMPPPF